MTNIFSALVKMWMNNRENHDSTFNQRVEVRTTLFQMVPDNNGTASFTYKADIIGADGTTLREFSLETDGQEGYVRINQEILEALLTVAFSGRYMTPYDEKRWMLAFTEFSNRGNCPVPYECDECHEQFGDDLDGLINHLRETNHKDSFYDVYPEWCKENL